jgi:hypothetical protein
MSDPSGPRHRPPAGDPESVDELISAYLDGEATADEVARVDADPALLARVTELRTVVSAVAGPVDPPTAEVREAHIAAAVAAAGAPAEPTGGPADLAEARAERDRRRRRLAALSVAAAVLVAVLAVPLLARLGDDGDTETAAVEDRESSAADESAPTTTLAGPSSGSDADTGAGGAVGEGLEDDLALTVVVLGTFDDEDALVGAVARAHGAPPDAEAAQTTSPFVTEPRCPPPQPSDAEITGVYEANLAGAPVTVYVLRTDTGESALVLDATCDPMLQSDL